MTAFRSGIPEAAQEVVANASKIRAKQKLGKLCSKIISASAFLMKAEPVAANFTGPVPPQNVTMVKLDLGELDSVERYTLWAHRTYVADSEHVNGLRLFTLLQLCERAQEKGTPHNIVCDGAVSYTHLTLPTNREV